MVKLIKFCIVGGINTLVSLLAFYILNKLLNLNYIASSIIAYILGMVNSFILNRKWTFNNSDKKILLQLVKFTIINSVSLGINLFVMYILVDRMHNDSMFAQVIATFFSTIFNYLGSRTLVFIYPKKDEQLV